MVKIMELVTKLPNDKTCTRCGNTPWTTEGYPWLYFAGDLLCDKCQRAGKESFKFHRPTPEITFDYMEHNEWVGYQFKDIKKQAHKLRVAIKESINYFWSNSHFKIKNIYGKPVISVLFNDNSIDLWNFVTGDGLFTLSGEYFTVQHKNRLSEAINKISKGYRRCNQCGLWVREGKTYSFAGFVCSDCYNPKIHLPPDTSGD